MKKEKVLVVFDFDHTVIDDNSDLSIVKLLPNEKVPHEIRGLFTKKNWTVYMGEIFKHLHKNGKTQTDILDFMKKMKLAPGIEDLLNYLSQNLETFDNIIVSDSNSVFIDCILKELGFWKMFDKIFTNPAQFDDSGCLNIQYYHTQDWCDLSTVNLCKGHIMESYIKEQKEEVDYTRVVYVGDGKNDLCPSLRLGEQDLIFARKTFTLHKLIQDMQKSEEERKKLKAKVWVYESGNEIMDILKTIK